MVRYAGPEPRIPIHNTNQEEATNTMATNTEKDKEAPKAPKEPKAKKAPDVLCQCYSEPVPGKPNTYQSCGRLSRSRFAPGHDAKLKGLLIKAARDGDGTLTLQEADGTSNKVDVAKYADGLGWAKYIDRALEIKAERAEKAAAKAADKAASAADRERKSQLIKDRAAAKKADAKPGGNPQMQVKLGRWMKDCKVVGRDGDQLVVEYEQGGETKQATVPESAVIPRP